MQGSKDPAWLGQRLVVLFRFYVLLFYDIASILSAWIRTYCNFFTFMVLVDARLVTWTPFWGLLSSMALSFLLLLATQIIHKGVRIWGKGMGYPDFDYKY